jgi:hypothetical protein
MLTLAARKVLLDFHVALTDWAEREYSDDRRWRIGYLSCVSLLRTVGYVLRNVDSKRNDLARKVIDEHYRRWKRDEEHEIFTAFIEQERNLVLKEYQFNADPRDAVKVPLVSLDESLNPIEEVGSVDMVLFADGPLQGYHVDQLMWDSYEWWVKQLGSIERALASDDKKV